MKRKYIHPKSITIQMNIEKMIALSQFSGGDNNVIDPGEGEYEGDFQSSKKEFPWED